MSFPAWYPSHAGLGGSKGSASPFVSALRMLNRFGGVVAPGFTDPDAVLPHQAVVGGPGVDWPIFTCACAAGWDPRPARIAPANGRSPSPSSSGYG